MTRRPTIATRPTSAGAAWRAAVVAVVLLIVLAARPASASAHAVLVSTEPATGTVVADSPARLVLRFNEPVSVDADGVALYDSDGERVDIGAVAAGGERFAVELPALERGTYTVGWRAKSPDTHAIRGAFAFHVGAPDVSAPAAVDRTLAAQDEVGPQDALTIARTAAVVLLLIGAGGAAGAILAVGRACPGARRTTWTAIWAAAVAAAAASLATIPLQHAVERGIPLGDALAAAELSAALDDEFGRIAAVRVVLALGLAALAGSLRRGPERTLEGAALGIAAGLAATPALAGHARADGLVAMAADTVHVAAAGLWIGGLLAVAVALLAEVDRRWEAAGEVVPRLSAIALGSVAALLVAGTASAWMELPRASALWETTYGRLLLAKIGILLPVLALAAVNRGIVPALRDRSAGPPARRRFARGVGAELALLAVAVAVAGVLAQRSPDEAVAAAGPVEVTADLGPLRAGVIVTPAAAGRNILHVTLSDQAGRLVRLDDVRLLATLPSRDLGPMRLRTEPAGPGHVIVPAASLAIPGDWRLRLEARRGEFDLYTHTFTIPIREASPQ
jgi:copper transport protein